MCLRRPRLWFTSAKPMTLHWRRGLRHDVFSPRFASGELNAGRAFPDCGVGAVVNAWSLAYNEKPKPRRRSHIGKRPLTACRDSDLRSNNFATMPVYAQRFAREELRISSVFQSSTDWIHLHEPNKTMIQTPLPRISDVFAQMSPDDFHLHPFPALT